MAYLRPKDDPPVNGPLAKLDIAKKAKEDAQPVDLWSLSFEKVVDEARKTSNSAVSFGRNISSDE